MVISKASFVFHRIGLTKFFIKIHNLPVVTTTLIKMQQSYHVCYNITIFATILPLSLQPYHICYSLITLAVVGLPNNSYKPITNTAWVRTRLCKLQLQVMKFTSCLPMVGGSLRVLRLLPPLKLVAMI